MPSAKSAQGSSPSGRLLDWDWDRMGQRQQGWRERGSWGGCTHLIYLTKGLQSALVKETLKC